LNLIEYLVSKYGRPDKRRKRFTLDDWFVVDDRQDRDFDARGELFLWFCGIHVQVIDNNKIRLTLRGNVPSSDEVDVLLRSFEVDFDEDHATFVVHPDSLACLDSLADALRNIVAPGKTYTVNSYKYVCPRTADSLLRLRDGLSEFWFNTDPAMIDPILRRRSLNLDLN
jgi:hypothetical protein